MTPRAHLNYTNREEEYIRPKENDGTSVGQITEMRNKDVVVPMGPIHRSPTSSSSNGACSENYKDRDDSTWTSRISNSQIDSSDCNVEVALDYIS